MKENVQLQEPKEKKLRELEENKLKELERTKVNLLNILHQYNIELGLLNIQIIKLKEMMKFEKEAKNEKEEK